jgi:hypothetical protein
VKEFEYHQEDHAYKHQFCFTNTQDGFYVEIRAVSIENPSSSAQTARRIEYDKILWHPQEDNRDDGGVLHLTEEVKFHIEKFLRLKTFW